MKRSEMIEKIEYLVSTSNNYPSSEELLDLIEKFGMKPPMVESRSFIMLESGELMYEVNEWENE